MNIDTFLGPHEIHFLLDLALSLLIGIVLGWDRERRGKAAGISTLTLVITGSMLFTFLSATADPNSDSRIAAQIVSGIGFLGAGIIMKEGTNVINLTTAASIWYVGAIGMAIGFNFHVIAFLAAIGSLIITNLPSLDKDKPKDTTNQN